MGIVQTEKGDAARHALLKLAQRGVDRPITGMLQGDMEHGDGIGVRVEHRHDCVPHNVPPCGSRRLTATRAVQPGWRSGEDVTVPATQQRPGSLGAIGASSSVGVP